MTSYYIDPQAIYCSDGRVFSKPDALNSVDLIFTWMLTDKPKENKLLYDLDACVAGLISMTMSEAQARELYEKEKVYVNDFKITYFPTRFFAIDGRGSFVNYGNMVRYKSDVHYSPDDTEEDKINKAKEAEAISVAAKGILRELGVDPQRIISPVGALVDKYVWSLRPPTVDDIPEEAGEIAYQTIKGNWLEAFSIGYWDEAYDYDINCYSEDTECLTYNGWKRVIDLEVDEEILGFNKDTEKCRFQPVRKMHKSYYDGDMVSLKSRKVDLLVTQNHRILLQHHVRSKMSRAYKEHGKGGYFGWSVCEAGKLPNGNYKLPISFPIEERNDYEISDEELKIIAWINTEGSIYYNKKRDEIKGIAIKQTESSEANKSHCQEIEECLGKIGRVYKHYISQELYAHLIKAGINKVSYKDQIAHNFRIPLKHQSELYLEDNIHFIPLWILQKCSYRQLKIYFETLIKGDGHRSLHEKTNHTIQLCYYSKLKENADRMGYLCHLLGYKVNFVNPNKHHVTYQVYIIAEKEYEWQKKDAHNEAINYGDKTILKPYKGMVSCPTIDDGYFVVRRNNKSYICGNSAYGSVLSRLLDTRRGTWVEDIVMPKEAVYGFASGNLEVTKPFHPFIMKEDDKYTYTPIGSRPDQLTKEQIDLLYKHDLGHFDIERGWWWIPSTSKSNYEPLRGIINHLHNIRAESEGLKKVIIRQMIAGIWGRMVEIRKEKLGKLFNPVWGSIVENSIKCQVVDTCLSLGVIPLLVAVDGVITDKPLPIKETTDMGGWRLSHKGRCIISSSGVVGFEGKAGAEEFALSFDWLHNQLSEQPNESEYSMTKYSPLSLAKSLQSDDFQNIGELQLSNRVIIIGKDYKRMWREYPQTGGELLTHQYDSLPVDSVMTGAVV